MSESLRALIVIIILATTFFAFVHRSACSIAGTGNFTRRRNLWLVLTASAFLAPNFWVYTIIAIVLLIRANRHEINTPSLFFFVLFVLPVASVKIPGMGLVNFIFELSYARILALIILLPAFFVLLRRSDSEPFGRSVSEKALAIYLLLSTVLYLRESSVTDSLRQFFYLFLDVFLPYYVISRTLKNLQAFREAMLSIVLAIMLLALIAIFEAYRHWLLYPPLLDALELGEGMTAYLGRDGMLRAIASASQPIALGYLMVIGIGSYLFLQRSLAKNLIKRLGMVLLVAGLVVPLSRGPWVGAVVLLLAFIATGRNPVRRLISLALAAMLAFALISILPGGERVINLLPYVGSTEKGNVDYREKLITNSMIVIERNPWFGTPDYLQNPEMESMRQGQGIIDVVNTYIWLVLEKGYVGLGLFVGFFAVTLLFIYQAMRAIPDRDSDEYMLGRVLLATLLSIMVIIATVSSISFIPVMYWSVAGLAVAYAQMIRKNKEFITAGKVSA